MIYCFSILCNFLQRVRVAIYASSLLLIVFNSSFAQNVSIDTMVTTLPLGTSIVPRAIAKDVSGNLFIADSAHVIWKVEQSTGVLSVFAGNGTMGTANGQGTSAQFNDPRGIAVDTDGNVYVADFGNNLIRKITSAGLVSTFAGSGAMGGIDGMGVAAQFNQPHGIATDAAGYVYVAEYFGYKVRKIAPDGHVITLAGSDTFGSTDGQGTAASFSVLTSIAVAATGDIYVTDLGNQTIRKITAGGLVSRYAGQTGSFGTVDGDGLTQALFYNPYGIAVSNSGHVYVADRERNLIRKISPDGIVSSITKAQSASYRDGSVVDANFFYPIGLIVNDAEGALLVVDQRNRKIRKIGEQKLQVFRTTPDVSSTAQKLIVSASGLISDLVVNGPPDFEISETEGFNYVNFLTYPQSGGVVTPKTVFIRLKSSLPSGSYDAFLTLFSNSAPSKTFRVLGVVGKLPQTIAFDAIPSKNIWDNKFTLVGAASSSLPITYKSSDNKVAKVVDNIITIIGAGTCTITASQAGNENYDAAANVVQVLNVGKPEVSVSISGANKILIGEVKPYTVVWQDPLSPAASQSYRYDWFFVKTVSGKQVYMPAITDENSLYPSNNEKVNITFPSYFKDSKLVAIVSVLQNGSGNFIPYDTVSADINLSAYTVSRVLCSDTLGCSAYKIVAFEYADVKLDQKVFGIECPVSSLGYSDFATSQYVYKDSLGAIARLDMVIPELYTSTTLKLSVIGDTVQYYGFWLDANGNGSFGDPGEFLGHSAVAALDFTAKINIPNHEGATGIRRLRVKCNNKELMAADYCITDLARLGETEDYLISLEPYPDLKAPEAFTPGGDGYNDFFVIRGVDPVIDQKYLVVFDKFGRKLYSMDNYDNSWNGTTDTGDLLPNGTYYYEFLNGERKINGFIELVAESR